MATFTYSGVDKKGKKVKGTAESASKNALLAELVAKGIFADTIKPVRAKEGAGGIDRLAALKKYLKPSKKGSGDMFFQLAVLLKSGIPLVEAIRIIANNEAKGRARAELLDIASTISEGVRFSEALSKSERFGNEMHVNLIRASEQVGRLADVLMDIAAYEEEKKKSVDKVTSALVYPITVLVLGLSVLGFLLAYVVPKMESIFNSVDREIPGTTKFLLAFSKFLSNWGFVMFLLLFAAVIAARIYYAKNDNVHLKVDAFVYRSDFVRQVMVTKFAHVLSFQLKEGLQLTQALAASAATVNNRWFRSQVDSVVEDVKAGRRFSESAAETGAFPELFTAAVATGEKSGNLSELLERVSDFYGRKVEKFTSRFISVMEPLFIVMIGLVVGFIVISIMEPLFQINTLVG